MNPICTHIQDRLIEQHLNRQTGPDDAAIQAHLQTCAHCREFQKQLDRDHDRLAQYARSVEPLVTGLKDRVAQRLASARQRRGGLQRLYVSIAAGVAIVVAVWAVLHGPETPPVSTSEPRPIAAEPAPLPIDHTVDQEQAQAKALFASRDINRLMDLLDTGLPPTQALVAGYLAELNASQAAPVLQRLTASWPGDPSTNPFAQAMTRIKVSGQEPNRAQVEQASAKAPSSPVGRRLKIKVVDKATGLPLPGTQVEDGRYVCDANGCCQVDVQDNTSWEVWVSKPGYVGTSVDFQLITEEVLSETYLFALDRGTSIGGIVQDANGVPVEGATIRIFLRPEHDGTTKPFIHIFFEQRTDASGRWLCDTMPSDLLNWAHKGNLDFNIEHPDYIRPWGGEVRDNSVVKEMMDQTYCTTLHEGSTLRGRVINEKGEPIGGAKVNSCITKSDGTFLTLHIDPNTTKMDLTIDAEEYPHTVKRIDYRPDMADVEIVLKPGWSLSGRVVDTEGMQLTGVEIRVVNGPYCRIRRSTDADGRYFTGPLPVPIGIMNVGANKAGFMDVFRIVERPIDGPMDFVLHRQLHVTGHVINAQTGRPMDRFRIRACTVDSEGKIKPEASTDLRGPDHYKHTFAYFCETGYVIAIEADGYLPAASRVIGLNEREPVINFALRQGTGPVGTIVDVNGLAVAEAWIYAIPENCQAWYWKPLSSLSSDNGPLTPEYPCVKTKTDGRFSFEPIYQLHYFVVFAEQGICSETVSNLDQAKLLVLLPWAEVRGTVHDATGEPVKNQSLEMASLPDAADRFGYKWSLSTNTNDQGTFQIQRVPPGEFTLLGKTYQVAPGQVLSLDVTVDPNAP